MKTLHTLSSLLAASLFFMVGGAAQAQNVYSITVDVDDTTAGDIQLVDDFLTSAADGQEVSKSLRRITMGALGEVSVSAKARINPDGILTLDDGGTVALFEDDVIAVAAKTPFKKLGPIFACSVKKPNGSMGGCQPECVITPNGAMPIPPIGKNTCKIIVLPPKG